jgi:hypothetical protein
MLRHGARPERVGRRGRDGERTIYKAGRVKVLSHRGDRDCCMPPHSSHRKRVAAVFENSMGTKNLEASESITFYKIQRNSRKFNRNVFDERKEQKFFENTKISRICRIIQPIIRSNE